MKKTNGLLLCGALAVSIAVTGCSSTTSTSKELSVTSAPKVQEKPVKILMSEPRESNQEDMDKVKKYIEEKSGVKFEIVNVKTANDFDQRINLALASDEDIDVILVGSQSNYQTLTEKNALLDIKDLVDSYGKNLKKQYPSDIWKAVTDSTGAVRGIPRMSVLAADTLSIRKDWREKLGLPPITTLAEFEAYMRAIKDADLDGNGIKDTIPFITNKQPTSMGDTTPIDTTLGYVFTETNPSGNYLDEKGNIKPIYQHPEYKQYLSTLAKWKTDGLLYADVISVKKAQVDDFIINNRVGAFAAWYSDYVRPLEKLKAKVPNAEYEVVQLKTLKGNAYKFRQNLGLSQRAVVLKTSKNAEWAIKLFDWMLASPENYYSTKWGTFGEYWDWVDKDKGIVKRLKGGENPEKSYNFAYSMMFYGPWDFRGQNPNFIDKRYYEAWDYFDKNKDNFVLAPDWFINYNLKESPVYNTQQDAFTLIQEHKAKMILGQESPENWDKIMEQFNKLYGTAFSELATKEYKTYKK
jgi:putative aldouronate transport system substrate-binding protein